MLMGQLALITAAALTGASTSPSKHRSFNSMMARCSTEWKAAYKLGTAPLATIAFVFGAFVTWQAGKWW